MCGFCLLRTGLHGLVLLGRRKMDRYDGWVWLSILMSSGLRGQSYVVVTVNSSAHRKAKKLRQQATPSILCSKRLPKPMLSRCQIINICLATSVYSLHGDN